MRLSPHRTPLDRFIAQHQIKPTSLADEAGIARQHVYRLRCGSNPSLSKMLVIRDACRRLTGLPVRVAELFDLGEG